MTYVMLIDTTMCVTCYTCQIACKDEYYGNNWPPYSAAQPQTGEFWMKVTETEYGTGSRMKLLGFAQPCMQCSDAPCISAATNGAIYRRTDGIVIIDPVKAVGQQQVVAACPYGAIYWNEASNLPQKCTFCAHLLDQGWPQPRCVEACQGTAIQFGTLAQLEPTIVAQGYVPLHPEYGTQPNVYYKYSSVATPTNPFISGSVFSGPDVVIGCTITATDLVSDNQVFTTSDPLGNFWITGLDQGKAYLLKLSAPGLMSREQVVFTDKSKDIGDIELFA